MNNEQVYYHRNMGLIKVLDFTKRLLENELKQVNNKYSALQVEIYGYTPQPSQQNPYPQHQPGLVDKGIPVPESVGQEYQFNGQFIHKLTNELNYVNYLINNANYIMSNQFATQEQKFNNLQAFLDPFFKEHNNVYAGNRGTGAIDSGQSHFESIVQLSDKYGKLENQIQQLNDTISLLTADHTAKQAQYNDYDPNSRLNKKFEKDKKFYQNGIDRLNQQKAQMESGQKVIMLNRALAENKKNKLISKIEGKALDKQQRGDITSYNYYANMANNLKDKPIKVLPTPVLLFKEAAITKFKQGAKNFGRYMKGAILMGIPGKPDKRSWEEVRAEELENKVHKKL